ncbi:MAG: polysaccharide deacetylase family protein [Deltaproteobacteria bacterium]|nr:polysaccharide deacetylase family protein [Deltaproteobacteria bacterium]MBK8240127.1 polysaccharide deacetylase family protein [Deltaproteobacteria bacterium]MBK8715884.1 polysaccharide deacetylase family protein [Deltaproteobacteria bacterium]MBP7286615.1 polysaccharide deacetylase family protein [Nannocystaceae bacterium]
MSLPGRLTIAACVTALLTAGGWFVRDTSRGPAPVSRHAPSPRSPAPAPVLREHAVAHAAIVPPVTPRSDDVDPPAPRTRYFGAREGDRIALSFDDGPRPASTARVLAILREHDAHATFFMLGEQVQRHPEAAAAVAAAGHELGNHGWSHRSWKLLFPSQLQRELDDTADAIADATGTTPHVVRPPFGRFPESAVAIVHGRGDDLVLWSVDSLDSAGADADTIARTVVDAARPGDIVLLHDREWASVRALPQILAGLRRKGLRVVPVSQLD